MKTVCVLALTVFCTAGAWAGVGETRDATVKRCGEPGKWDKESPPPAGRGLTIAQYTTTNAAFRVFFFDKGGKSISGAIMYELPQGKEQRNAAVKKALDENADGKTWTVSKNKEPGQESYQREGTKACFFKDTWFSVSSADFDAYVSEANKTIAQKQAADKLAAEKQAAAAKQAAAVKQAAAQKAATQKTTSQKTTVKR